MSERSVTHSTFVIERTYPAKPARVFKAFAETHRSGNLLLSYQSVRR